MRVAAAAILFVVFGWPAIAQPSPSAPKLEPEVPRTACRYDRLSIVQRVKAAPSIEIPRFDLSSLFAHRVFFRTGTLVGVSRREGSWSCVTGGSPSRTGWLRSSQLEAVDQSEHKPGSDN
jgi:hypothetical protein